MEWPGSVVRFEAVGVGGIRRGVAVSGATVGPALPAPTQLLVVIRYILIIRGVPQLRAPFLPPLVERFDEICVGPVVQPTAWSVNRPIPPERCRGRRAAAAAGGPHGPGDH